MIELQIEQVLWTLEREEFPGGRPSTDAKQIGDLLVRLNEAATNHRDEEIGAMVSATASTVSDLLEIRNTIVHGIPRGDDHANPTLVRNWSIWGEKRKRDSTSFVLSEEALDELALALDAVFKAAGRVASLVDETTALERWFALEVSKEISAARETAASLKSMLVRA